MMRSALPFLLLLLLGAAGSVAAATITTEDSGELQFLIGADVYSSAYAGAFGPGWEWSSQAEAPGVTDTTAAADHRLLTGAFAIAATSATCAFREEVSRVDDRTLDLRYDFTVDRKATVNSLFVRFTLPWSRYAGRKVTAYSDDGSLLQSTTLPETFGTAQLWSQDAVARIEIAAGEDISYTLGLSSPASVLLQDNRQWGTPEFEVRIESLGSRAGGTVPAGSKLSRSITVSLPEKADFQLDPAAATSHTDTTGWVPYTIPWDSAPLDLSRLNEAPAGSHGFVSVRNGRLAFEDGTPARFWGVCNSAAANFPTHAQSEKIAARLAKFGVNMLRTHHADADWSNPNFFDESSGDTQHFDPDALDRFDYFVAQLKQHGVYIYLDQLVHRKFTAADGVASADQLDNAAKPYTIFDPRLIELQKEFSRALWAHVNPYTGLAYKDDPAIALMDFTNENDLFTYDITVEPYASELERRWREWAATRDLDPDQPLRRISERTPDVLRFLDEVQKSYYADMHASLRSLGVKVPMAGDTWLVVPANLPSQVTMDYMDGHSYWDHPTDEYSRWENRRMVETNPAASANNMSVLAASRVYDKPFVASEWGHPWPNEWRAEGALPMAAVGSLQSWDGILAYTYRHSAEVPVDTLSGQFDTFNDPAVFGLFPAAALLYRRGDVSDNEPPTAVLWKESDLFASPQTLLWNSAPAYRSLVEKTPVVTALAPVPGAKATLSPGDSVPPTTPTSITSDNGQLHRDWQRGLGTIDTPRTQAVYGNVGAAGKMDLTDASFDLTSPFATVVLSSLDDRHLRASGHLLLTAVGRAENTGMRYNLTHTRLRDPGSSPILIEPILGRVSVDVDGRNWRIYAVDATGARRLLSEVHLGAGERLTIPLTASAATIYYEVESSD